MRHIEDDLNANKVPRDGKVVDMMKYKGSMHVFAGVCVCVYASVFVCWCVCVSVCLCVYAYARVCLMHSLVTTLLVVAQS